MGSSRGAAGGRSLAPAILDTGYSRDDMEERIGKSSKVCELLIRLRIYRICWKAREIGKDMAKVVFWLGRYSIRFQLSTSSCCRDEHALAPSVQLGANNG